MVRPENLTFYIKFDLKGQSQLPPKTIGILTKLFSTSGPNLVILAWMGNALWCGQVQNGVNSDFEVNLTLKVKVEVFCIFGPNLVILAWMGPELSCGQTWWRTDGLADGRINAGNDNTRPKLASGNKREWKSLDYRLHNLWHSYILCLTIAGSRACSMYWTLILLWYQSRF